jgi:hypothetical protein
MRADARKSFTQLLMFAGTLSLPEAEKYLRRISDSYAAEHVALEIAVQEANRKLLPLELEIQIVVSELDGLRYVTMVNTRADVVAQKYAYLSTESEVKYFKLLVNFFLK